MRLRLHVPRWRVCNRSKGHSPFLTTTTITDSLNPNSRLSETFPMKGAEVASWFRR